MLSRNISPLKVKRLRIANARKPLTVCRTSQTSETHALNRRNVLLSAFTAPVLLTQLPSKAAEISSYPELFFEVQVDGRPAGKFVIELFDDTGVAAQRFADLTQGKEGVSFRRTKIELIQDAYIQDTGLKALSYKASGRTSIAGGPDNEVLEGILAKQTRSHDAPGLVSFVVRNKEDLVTKEKLVASKGRLITVTETFGEIPNGSSWCITTKAELSLDSTNVIVGRVVSGQEVVDAIAALPRVKNNESSPFFQAGKLSGDKRANVAERAFGKPFSKIIIEECGFI